MTTYLSRHLQVLFATLGNMLRSPVSTLNTLLIIAVTLLLPCLLYIALQTAQSLSENWQGRPQFTVFMSTDTSIDTARLIYEEIQLHPDVELSELLTPAQALDEFKLQMASSGRGDLNAELEFLGKNPLPSSIVVMPNLAAGSSENLSVLKQQLSEFDGVDHVNLDLAWIDRFTAIVDTFQQVSRLLSVLLGFAMVFIIGNVIKLLIFKRRQEIEITKLVGGTNAFVRRPFLYFGALHGFAGALIALALVLIAAHMVAGPLTNLATSYQTDVLLYRLSPKDVAVFLGIGSALGWLAARWSVALHLHHIRPS